MEIEVKVRNAQKEELDSYFYATTDIEYALNDAKHRAHVEHWDDWNTVTAYYYGEDESIGSANIYGDFEIHVEDYE